MESLREPARDVPVRHRADVLVVGGGTAGVAAAAAAAREGADVVLVERNGYLGGLATGGLIILLLTLDDGCGRQVVAGLCQEVVDRLVARGGRRCPAMRRQVLGELVAAAEQVVFEGGRQRLVGEDESQPVEKRFAIGVTEHPGRCRAGF